MAIAKLHWSEGRQPSDVLWVTLCGQLVVEVASHPDDVTCKLCRRAIEKMRPDTSANDYVEAVLHRRAPVEFSPPQPLVDQESGLPFVSPFTWGTIKDTRHWCAHCPVCSWFNAIEADANAAPWKKRHETRDTRFSSVNAALRWYIEIRNDGFSMGTIGDALMRIGKLGAVIRSNGHPSTAIEQADDAHEVERALVKCYQSVSKRGLSRAERLYVLFSVAMGRKPHEVAREIVEASSLVEKFTGPMASATASEGRLVVYEYLSERGMVPKRWNG